MDEPVGRESIFEELLDGLSPLLEGEAPVNTHLYGPPGAGKSAVATALSSTLQTVLTNERQAIYTSTRAPASGPNLAVAYLDTRYHPSQFQVLQRFLEAVSSESVPDRGVSTNDVRRRLVEELGRYDYALLVADHVGESETPGVAELDDYLDPLPDVCWLTVSRDPLPGGVATRRATSVDVPKYDYGLVDILMNRGGSALSTGLDHQTAKRVADWADGNAHHALAALYGAAVSAVEAGETRLTDDAVDRGMAAVPDHCVSLGRVLALPENKQRVLTTILRVDYRERSVKALSEEVASRTSLSQSTVHRYIYELAQADILERHEFDSAEPTVGRAPSRVELHFPTLVYRFLRENRG